MSRDTREHIPRRSHFLAAGLVVGKRLDDGELVPFPIHPCDLSASLAPCPASTTHHPPPSTTPRCRSLRTLPVSHASILPDAFSSTHFDTTHLGLKDYAYMDISDLLVRHEKLVHLNEGNKDGGRPRKASSGNGQAGPADGHGDTEMLGLQHQAPQPHYPPGAMTSVVTSSLPPDPRIPARAAPACNLDLLSDAATHLASASEVNPMQQSMMAGIGPPQDGLTRVKTYDEGLPYSDRSREQESVVIPGAFQGHSAQPSFDDYHLFLDDFASSSHFLPPVLESEQSFGLWSRPLADMRGPSKPSSSFPSRFPSLAPDPRDPEGTSRMQDDLMRAPTWRISAVDHTVIKNRLDEFSSVLPNDFVFPSRHTLTRFLEGYISGFHEHLPFLHIPTLSPTDLAPELLLAILSVGAQYRFESHRGHALWYAAKAVALEQIRRRHSHEVHGLLPTPAAYSPHSTRPSPSSGFRHSFTSVHQDRPMTQDTHREP